mmetsp:Transcript_7769/g.14103  ORF Transcript_7769/g.14103 Transcript_7769/m.14103 type:complete len:219 (-) Transcript_7769:2617-3273(-)
MVKDGEDGRSLGVVRMQTVRRKWDDSEVVKLNIGGEMFCTSVLTLTSGNRSEYWTRFLHGGLGVFVDDAGAIFVDRDGTQFRHILAFLRSAVVAVDESNIAGIKLLLAEAQFYVIPELISILQAMLQDAERSSANLKQAIEEFLADKSLASHAKPNQHSRTTVQQKPQPRQMDFQVDADFPNTQLEAIQKNALDTRTPAVAPPRGPDSEHVFKLDVEF